MVDCSLEIHGLFQIWLPTKAGIYFMSLHHKTTCGFHSVQCCGLHLLAFWVSLNVEVSTFPKWHVWMFGPFCDGCQMLECAMFRSYCKSFLPSMKKEKWAFFFFSSRVQLLTLTTNLKLAMRVIQIKKTTGNARLSSSTEWNYSVEKGRHVWLTMTVVFRNHN